MTPRERFDRLFDRVMRASEGGDAATVSTFAPMALAAYDSLPSPDVDARFHAALVQIAVGDHAAADVLAGDIAAEQPTHLFAILIRGSVAERSQNQAALREAHQAFLAAHPGEMAAQRPEYTGHQAIIDRFLADANLLKGTGR